MNKEDLLKLLFNRGQETPGTNTPTFIRLDDVQNNLADTIEETGATKFSATPHRVLYRNSWTIAFSERSLIAMKPNGVCNVWNLEYTLIDLYADDVGFYGIINDNTNIRLVYFYDFTELSPDGNYNLHWKTSYNITSLITEVSGDNSPISSSYCGAYKIAKSPLDR